MRCPFCQNCGIAQPSEQTLKRMPLKDIGIQALAGKIRDLGLKAVAYTYNEPALQAEYIIAAAPVLREAGIATVLVSNGMYSESLLRDLAPVVDAANIDVKSFNAKTYAKMGGSLDTVKRVVAGLLEADVHVEVTTLVVPGISDSPEEFVQETEWLAGLSPDIPLHISRYRPAHKYDAPPTDIELMQRFAMMAQLRLKHVHIGNVSYLRI
jgi:pyruvate formate lyase activating enzyme